VRHSLAAVAAYLERERRLDGVRALHGMPHFTSRAGALSMVRTARRFGFDVIDADAPTEWRDHVNAVFDGILPWGLAHAFNPGALKTKGLLRCRCQLWMSRSKLLSLYGVAGTCTGACRATLTQRL
jgi:hypothetical protein